MCTLSRFLVSSVIAALLPWVAQAAPFAYVTNGGSNDISVIDIATNALVAVVPVGNEPEGVAVNVTGTRIYVTNQKSNSVSVIDSATNTLVATVPVGTWPRGITVNPSGTRVYVANYASGSVSIIDATRNTVIGTVGVDVGPRGIVSDPSGARVYVSNWSAGSIQAIDTATNTVTTLPCYGGAPAGIALNPAGTRMYVANAGDAEVAIYDMVTNSCVDRIRVGAYPYGVAVNKAGTRLYVTNNSSATVSVIDTGSNAVIATISVGQDPYGVAIDTAGGLAYVANQVSNNLSVIDAESNTVIATVAAGRFPSAFGQFIGPAVVTPDLNQHGLTGSWYEPATSGQGVELEVFPDLSAPGTGLAFMSWFTFDSVSGGAERQRWYTAEGPVVTGQPNATLTIYQNTDGNFNALPITAANAVGTATLSFDSCTTGLLTYIIADDTIRTGSIPLSRLTQNVTCSITSARPTNPDFGFSGNWYDPATSGQGVTVEVNPGSKALFLAWYTYAPNGAGAGPAGQRWYTAEQTTALMPGARTIPVRLFETTGGSFNMRTSPAPITAVVGGGAITFQSCSSATLSYSFTGGSSSGARGTIALKRVGPVPAGCAM